MITIHCVLHVSEENTKYHVHINILLQTVKYYPSFQVKATILTTFNCLVLTIINIKIITLNYGIEMLHSTLFTLLCSFYN